MNQNNQVRGFNQNPRFKANVPTFQAEPQPYNYIQNNVRQQNDQIALEKNFQFNNNRNQDFNNRVQNYRQQYPQQDINDLANYQPYDKKQNFMDMQRKEQDEYGRQGGGFIRGNQTNFIQKKYEYNDENLQDIQNQNERSNFQLRFPISNQVRNNFQQNNFNNQNPNAQNFRQQFNYNPPRVQPSENIQAEENYVRNTPKFQGQQLQNFKPIEQNNKLNFQNEKDYQKEKDKEIDLTKEVGFTNNCIKSSNTSNLPISKIQGFVLLIQDSSNKKEENCFGQVVRLGRKKSHMMDLKNKEYFYLNDYSPDSISAFELLDSKLSKIHCDLLLDESDKSITKMQITDCKSLNGTYRRLERYERCKLNKGLVFYFMNVKFEVRGFYQAHSGLYISIKVADLDTVIMQIFAQESKVSLSHFSSNQGVAEIIASILKEQNIDYSKNNQNAFPFVTFDKNTFYLYSNQDNSISETLIKLECYKETKSKDSLIDILIGNVFNLGGELTISISKYFYLCNSCKNAYAEYENPTCKHIFCSQCASHFHDQGRCYCNKAIALESLN